MKRKYALPAAGGLALVLSAAFTPFMKHSVDSGLTGDAQSALASKGVKGVQVTSDWASLHLRGPASARTAALKAVHGMGNASAVNIVSYTTPTGSGTAAAGAPSASGSNGAAGSGSGSGASGAGATGGSAGSGAGAAPSASAGAAGNSGASGAGSAGSGSAGSGSGGSGTGSGGSGTGSGGSGTGGSGSGASATALEAQIRQALGSEGVTFNTNSDVLTANAQTVLNRVAAVLAKAPASHVTVAGYTDNQGSASSNLALSKARAQATRTYLAAHGVAASRMTAAGYGDADPVASNATTAGRAANRRIEFTVQGG